jgi:hypothetical protein
MRWLQKQMMSLQNKKMMQVMVAGLEAQSPQDVSTLTTLPQGPANNNGVDGMVMTVMGLELRVA